ncbi:MAG: ABC transporter ATP-binding protein [Lachnospiraceae bacterium]
MKQTTKPTYTVWQNTVYMLQVSWLSGKSIFLFLSAGLIVQVLKPLTELTIAPAILQAVESSASPARLLLTIAGFTLVLMLLTGLNTWLDRAMIPSYCRPQYYFDRLISEKSCTTAYANTLLTGYTGKYQQAVNALNDACELTEALANLLTALTGFALYAALLSGLNLSLVAIVTATAVIGYFVNRRTNEWAYRHREEASGIQRQMSYVYQTVMEGNIGKDIRIFGIGSWLKDIYNSALRLYQGFLSRREKHYLAADLADVLLAFLRNGIAYVYLIRLSLTQGLPASYFLLYFAAISGFTSWITTIFDKLSRLRKISLSVCELREYLELPEPFRTEGGLPLSCETDRPYELKLKHVSYRYPGGDKNTISDLNLTIHPGEKLAIVGLNGAGKTTLVKLLCGLLDPDKGQVLLNGQDIREFNRPDYYRLFSTVFQDVSLLDSTIAANVAQTEKGIDMERVADCIEKAGLTKAVNGLPAGLMTHLGRLMYDDGIELSGGQTQRLILARALYKDAPVLVLDEPTAALDPIAEHDVYMKYNEMSAGRTSIFISHRLASTRFCDRILFLANGAIAEEGTHEELISQNGGYAALFEVQSRYYQEGGEEHGKN